MGFRALYPKLLRFCILAGIEQVLACFLCISYIYIHMYLFVYVNSVCEQIFKYKLFQEPCEDSQPLTFAPMALIIQTVGRGLCSVPVRRSI